MRIAWHLRGIGNIIEHERMQRRVALKMGVLLYLGWVLGCIMKGRGQVRQPRTGLDGPYTARPVPALAFLVAVLGFRLPAGGDM